MLPHRRRDVGDATHWECMKFLRPGITENQVTAHLMEYLYSISPAWKTSKTSSCRRGPNTWPNWRNFSDRIIQPGDILFMDLAALTWNGYKSCYYRTYCVGKEPSQEQKDTYAKTALRWLYDLDRRGEGRRHHPRHRDEVALGHGDLGRRG